MCIDQQYIEIKEWSVGSEKNQLLPCSHEGWLNRNTRRQGSVGGLLIENKSDGEERKYQNHLGKEKDEGCKGI